MSNSTSGLTIPVKNHLKVSTFCTIQVDNLIPAATVTRSPWNCQMNNATGGGDTESRGLRPNRHQASWELCGKEGRTNDAYHCQGKLQADSRIDMFWKSMKIDVKSRRNGSDFGPWCALGSLRGSKITRKLPKAHLKGTPRRPKGALWEPQGRPKSVQGSPKSA